MMVAAAIVSVLSAGAISLWWWAYSGPRGGEVEIGSAPSAVTTTREAVLNEVTAAAPIMEISLTRDPGFSFGPNSQFREVTIHRDGKVTRHEFGDRDGTFQDETLSGSLGSEAFRDLEKLLHRKRFFSMPGPRYGMDMPCVEVKASNGSGVARVTDYSGFGEPAYSPQGFNEIVETIEKLVARITDWQKIK
jgi:hypothetical protein